MRVSIVVFGRLGPMWRGSYDIDVKWATRFHDHADPSGGCSEVIEPGYGVYHHRSCDPKSYVIISTPAHQRRRRKQPQELHHPTFHHTGWTPGRTRKSHSKDRGVFSSSHTPTQVMIWDLGLGIFIMWSAVWNVLCACSPPTIRSSFKRCEGVRLNGDRRRESLGPSMDGI